MMAWVLFVADFVKKLVHERELRLHEVTLSITKKRPVTVFLRSLLVPSLSHTNNVQFFFFSPKHKKEAVENVMILQLITLICTHIKKDL